MFHGGIETKHYHHGPFPGGPFADHLRVKLSGGNLSLCSSTDVNELGTAFGVQPGGGQIVLVRSYPGATPMIASEAISAGAAVFAAANGKAASSGTVQVGVALEAAAGDGSKFNVARV